MTDIVDFFRAAANRSFLTPDNELWIGFVIPQLVALGVLRTWQRRTGRTVWPALLRRRRVLGRSGRVDVALMSFAAFLPGLLTWTLVNTAITNFLYEHLPHPSIGHRLISAIPGGTVVSGTCIVVVVADLGTFLVHVAMHRWSVLWAFHAVHHDAAVLSPLSANRVHPVETLVGDFFGSVIAGVTFGLWVTMIDGQIDVRRVLGINVILLSFRACFASLRHSDVPLSFGPFDRVFVSPRMHQVHHSADPRHHNANYGQVLSIWDHLFGSYVHVPSDATLRMGVDGRPGTSIRVTLFGPFGEAARSVASSVVRARSGIRSENDHSVLPSSFCCESVVDGAQQLPSRADHQVDQHRSPSESDWTVNRVEA